MPQLSEVTMGLFDSNDHQVESTQRGGSKGQQVPYQYGLNSTPFKIDIWLRYQSALCAIR